MSYILVLTVQSTGDSRKLEDGMSLTVGRGAESGWILPDTAPSPTLSRQHCRFTVQADGASVTDLDSLNGTIVDGYALTPYAPALLQGREILELGPHSVLVEVRDVERRASVSRIPLLDDSDPFLKREAPTAQPKRIAAPPQDPLGHGGGATWPSPPVKPRPLQGKFERDPLADNFDEMQLSRRVARRVEEGKLRASGTATQQVQADSAFPPAIKRADLEHDPLAIFSLPAESNDEASRLAVDCSSLPRTEDANEGLASDIDQDPFGLADLNEQSVASHDLVGSGAFDGVAKCRADLGPHASAEVNVAPPAPAAVTGPLAAFLEGAGQASTVMEGRSPEAFLRDAGQVFAHLANGLRELLAGRAIVKEHARLHRTQIAATDNNPLKLSVNHSEATAALLRRGDQGYLPPLATVQASFRDLKAHEFAVLEGLQSAVDEMLELFEPVLLERKLTDAGMLATLLQGGKRAWLWGLYQERYEEIARAARTKFLGQMDHAFRQAYTRKTDEVLGHDGPPKGTLS